MLASQAETPVLLLDPGILVPPEAPPTDWRGFWIRLVEWSSDRRIKLGPASHAFIVHLYAELGYPHLELYVHPPALRHEYRKAIDRILTSITSASFRDLEVTFDIEYAGAREAETALRRDVPLDPMALASAPELWRRPAKALRCAPPPPESVQVVFEPNVGLEAEAVARAREWMTGRRLRLVGGQRDAAILARLADDFQIAYGNIEWLECERHKKPPVARRWGGLDPDRDIAICITGRVGHDTSLAAAKCARAANVHYLEVETANEIPARLRDIATG